MGLFRKSSEKTLDETLVAQVANLVKVVGDALLRLDALEDRLDALQAQHLKLRGRVYAIWGREEPKASEPNQEELPEVKAPTTRLKTRDELRRELTQSGRFVPGRPVQHSE